MGNQGDFIQSATMGNQSADSQVMAYRLDPDKLLDRVEQMLAGCTTEPYANAETGKIEWVTRTMGTPQANKLGLQNILFILSSVINRDSVQGNYTKENYEQHVEEIHKQLAVTFALNSDIFGIPDYRREIIIGSIMNVVRTFLSRLIDNKERESYGQTLKTMESVHSTKKDGFTLMN